MGLCSLLKEARLQVVGYTLHAFALCHLAVIVPIKIFLLHLVAEFSEGYIFEGPMSIIIEITVLFDTLHLMVPLCVLLLVGPRHSDSHLISGRASSGVVRLAGCPQDLECYLSAVSSFDVLAVMLVVTRMMVRKRFLENLLMVSAR